MKTPAIFLAKDYRNDRAIIVQNDDTHNAVEYADALASAVEALSGALDRIYDETIHA